jgi:hypothetical protein
MVRRFKEPQLDRSRLRLTDGSSGIACNAAGLHIGGVAVLVKTDAWHVRTLAELNAELSDRYGLPIDAATKTRAFEAVASALDRGDIAHAQLVTLYLRLPEPPLLEKRAVPSVAIGMAIRLQQAGLLKREMYPGTGLAGLRRKRRVSLRRVG